MERVYEKYRLFLTYLNKDGRKRSTIVRSFTEEDAVVMNWIGLGAMQ